MYQVVDQTGAVHGPVPIETLRQWAAERRLSPEMTVIEVATNQQGPAGQMLASYGIFVSAPPGQGMAAGFSAGYQQAQQAFPQAQEQFGFQGSDESGKVPRVFPRFAAFLVDFIIATGVMASVNVWVSVILWGWDTTWAANLGYAVPGLGAIVFLTRDALFPGQSIGKRIAKIKVISPNGSNANIVQSILRNLPAALLIFLPIPYVGKFVLGFVLIAFTLVEVFMVLTTGKRLCDLIARTLVVNE